MGCYRLRRLWGARPVVARHLDEREALVDNGGARSLGHALDVVEVGLMRAMRFWRRILARLRRHDDLPRGMDGRTRLPPECGVSPLPNPRAASINPGPLCDCSWQPGSALPHYGPGGDRPACPAWTPPGAQDQGGYSAAALFKLMREARELLAEAGAAAEARRSAGHGGVDFTDMNAAFSRIHRDAQRRLGGYQPTGVRARPTPTPSPGRSESR